MILGKIVGKTTTRKFKFRIESKAKKFQYIQVMHKEYGYVLCQIIEIERSKEEIADCVIIGYKKDNKILLPRSPFEQGVEVLNAEDKFIKVILSLEQDNPAYIGKLENRDIKIFLDLNKLLTRHIAIIAKTGAGKSYTAGVLIEEILDNKVPLLIIDPHGEYSQMKEAGKPDGKGYKDSIQEYGDVNIDEHLKPIVLNDQFSPQGLMHILPAKLSQAQKAVLYSTIKELNPVTLNSLIDELSTEEITNINLISILDYLKTLELFSSDFTHYEELIRPGKCSIINLKGIPPEVQEIIVYKLLKDLFEQRKLGNIAPFFTVIEESHNFAPERSFGETKSSTIIRTIASEGRKFGLGLCLLTQRPARLDKNVLSQCSSQIILKVTNPNDLRSIMNSVENISSETEDEIKNLAIGTALVTGVVDLPLLVKIRQRKSKHGGSTINILKETKGMLKDLEEFKNKEILPLILPKNTPKDIKLIEGKDKISPVLIPAVLVIHDKKKFLIEQIKGQLIIDIDTKKTIDIPIDKFSKSQKEILDIVLGLKRFNLAKLSQKTNTSVLKLKEMVDFFTKKGLLKKEDNNFMLTKEGLFLRNPGKFQTFNKIEFKQINYQRKLKPRVSREIIKKRFPHAELKDCFIVYYKVD